MRWRKARVVKPVPWFAISAQALSDYKSERYLQGGVHMTEKPRTVKDLKKLRRELIERRLRTAYKIKSAAADNEIITLAMLHVAIEALDGVIKKGKDEPEGPEPKFEMFAV